MDGYRLSLTALTAFERLAVSTGREFSRCFEDCGLLNETYLTSNSSVDLTTYGWMMAGDLCCRRTHILVTN